MFGNGDQRRVGEELLHRSRCDLGASIQNSR